MEEFKKYLAKVIKMLTRHTAILACGAASFFGGYQTKEPKNIYKRLTSKDLHMRLLLPTVVIALCKKKIDFSVLLVLQYHNISCNQV